MVAPAPINQLAQRLADYIRKERDRLLPFATPLLAEDRTVLEGFFESEFLDRVRVVVGVRVREPAFLRELDRSGLPIPSLSLAEALTLDFLIASNEALRLDTLVHELIHAIQYRALGIDAFARKYVASTCLMATSRCPWKGRQRSWPRGLSEARVSRQNLRLPTS
jgi:hypothetical protein